MRQSSRWLPAAVAAMMIAACRPVPAADGALLVPERTIPLTDVSGRIDHMAVDLARRRLAVAELGNDMVDIADLDSGRVVARISGLREPQGIAFAPAADLLAVANGGDGTVRFFRAADYLPAGSIELGDDADNIRLDARSGSLVVGYGSGALAVIEPLQRSKIKAVPLAVHPEGFQLAPDGRAFVNLPDAGQVAVVDLASARQVATWPMADLHSNFPLAVDATGTIVAIAFRGPPKLALFDAAGGAIVAAADSCGDADDVFFDEARRRLYVSCGEGAVAIFAYEKNGASLRAAGRIATASGARTALFVPELDRLFVAERASATGPAAILVLRPQP